MSSRGWFKLSEWVLLYQLRPAMPVDLKAIPLGVFLTREEAEQELQRRRAEHRIDRDGWIESAPIGV